MSGFSVSGAGEVLSSASLPQAVSVSTNSINARIFFIEDTSNHLLSFKFPLSLPRFPTLFNDKNIPFLGKTLPAPA
jgi:hypothetical protein